ncbi:thymidine kinase, cytosolic-like [Acanthaster planci]|uniref:Thymidine kinase n=1 Tax=Acanthaster planci TaxID=133434 RepID=A0A8B7XKE3_ACAPL|nr:thymidine kinase, cytosolic-like [Acanthaster planci]
MMARMNSVDNYPTKPGQIQVIFGPMFSGKTTELLRRIKRFEIANYSCLVIKYAKDDRYDKEGVATHDRQVTKAVSTECLYDLLDSSTNHDVIGIDEGQFFPDCIEFAEDMANQGKIVIVAALDGTFQRKGFGNILNLVPLAENVVKLNAVCMMCYQEASYTKRMGMETKLEVIGGADKYMAVCRECFNKPAHPSPTQEENGNSFTTPTCDGTTITSKVHGRKLFPSPCSARNSIAQQS